VAARFGYNNTRLVRNPDFIYKQVHNPDVTNPDLAKSGLRTCL